MSPIRTIKALFGLALDAAMYFMLALMFLSGFGFVTFAVNSAKTPPEALMAMTIALMLVIIPFTFMRSASKLSAIQDIVNDLKRQRKIDKMADLSIQASLERISDMTSKNTKSVNADAKKRRPVTVEK